MTWRISLRPVRHMTIYLVYGKRTCISLQLTVALYNYLPIALSNTKNITSFLLPGDQTEFFVQNLLFSYGTSPRNRPVTFFTRWSAKSVPSITRPLGAGGAGAPPGKIQRCIAPPGICDQHPHYGAEKAFLNVLLHSAPPQHPCWEARTFFFLFFSSFFLLVNSAQHPHSTPAGRRGPFLFFCQLGSAPPIKKNHSQGPEYHHPHILYGFFFFKWLCFTK